MAYVIKKNMTIRHLLNLPFIWAPLVPLILLDLIVEIYHQVGFRLCGIPLIKRSDYIKIDRHKLKYLKWSEKIGCVYCGYANGMAQYFVEIAGRTEKYWCAIKHNKYSNFHEPAHHINFAEYGSEEDYKLKFRH